MSDVMKQLMVGAGMLPSRKITATDVVLSQMSSMLVDLALRYVEKHMPRFSAVYDPDTYKIVLVHGLTGEMYVYEPTEFVSLMAILADMERRYAPGKAV